MATRRIAFNALPVSARNRLIDCFAGKGPTQFILGERPGVTSSIIGWILLLAVAGAVGYSSIAGRWRTIPEWSELGLLAGAAFVAIVSIVGIVRTSTLAAILPFRRGQYLLPVDYIEAFDGNLRIIPYSDLVDWGMVHHYRNGVYQNTKINFRFPGFTATFTTNRSTADSTRDRVRQAREALATAVDRGDENTLRALDPLYEVRVKDQWNAPPPIGNPPPLAGSLPWLLKAGAGTLASLVFGALVALPTFQWLRTYVDDQLYNEAKATDTASGWQSYIGYQHGLRADSVRKNELPRAAFHDAQSKNSVTALREFRKTYPQSALDDDAKKAIAALYESAFDTFQTQAATTNPKLVPFMKAMINWLAAHSEDAAQSIEMRFEPPTTSDLADVDKYIEKKSKDLATVSPHFGDEKMKTREGAMVARFADAWKNVFAEDIMVMKMGERLRGKKTIPSVPTMEISYDVHSTGTAYWSDPPVAGEKGFVGIELAFHVRMFTPGYDDKIEFEVTVKPPKTFETSKNASEGEVYDVMTERAFDELGTKLRKAFFARNVEPNDDNPMPRAPNPDREARPVSDPL
jgi:hypothetical protein